MKRILPLLVGIGCGVIGLLDFFLPNPEIDALGTVLVEGVTILAAFALLLGLLNLLSVHVKRLAGHGPRRGLSLLLILSLLTSLAVGVFLPASATLQWMFTYFYVPLQSSMTGLLAFFSVMAAYRSFRLRNVDALILMLTSLFLLFTQLPFGQTLWPELSAIRDWLLAIPVTAGARGILMGTALGTIATSLRILLTVDRPYLGE